VNMKKTIAIILLALISLSADAQFNRRAGGALDTNSAALNAWANTRSVKVGPVVPGQNLYWVTEDSIGSRPDSTGGASVGGLGIDSTTAMGDTAVAIWVGGYKYGPIAQLISDPLAVVDSVILANTASQDFSWPLPTAAGTGRATFVTLMSYNAGGTDSAVSVQIGEPGVGRRAATKIGLVTRHSNHFTLETWYVVAPTVGVDTILVSLAIGGYCSAVSVNCVGVNQSTPIGTPVLQNEATNTSTSMTVTSATGEMVMDFVSVLTTAPTGVGAGQTRILMYTGNEKEIASSYEAGAASVDMTWTLASSLEWCGIAFSVKP